MHCIKTLPLHILKGDLLPFSSNNDTKSIMDLDWEKIEACVLHLTLVHIGRTTGDEALRYEERGMTVLYAHFHVWLRS